MDIKKDPIIDPKIFEAAVMKIWTNMVYEWKIDNIVKELDPNLFKCDMCKKYKPIDDVCNWSIDPKVISKICESCFEHLAHHCNKNHPQCQRTSGGDYNCMVCYRNKNFSSAS